MVNKNMWIGIIINRRHDYFFIFTIYFIGMCLVPMKLMGFDLSFIPGDLGDARLNNYFLEHGFKWITGQVESFWDAPFFYPTVRTMSFSDNHLGTLPIYMVLRSLNFDRETAYQLWFLVLFTLNYFSCAWVLQKLSVNSVGVAAGAFLFTFSLPVIGQISHSQLLPRFMIPIGFYFAFIYFEKQQVKALAAVFLSIVFQFYCCIYIGFFLTIGVITFLIAYVLMQTDRLSVIVGIIGKSRKSFILKSAVIILATISLMPLIIPYYHTSLEYGLKPWNEISNMLPRIRSYFYPADGTLLWSWLMQIGVTLPMPHEHRLFPGGVVLCAFVIMPILYHSYRDDRLAKLGMTACLAIVLTVIVTLHGKYSLYKPLTSLPGIGAVRGVSRIILMLLFPLSLVLGVVITKLTAVKDLFLRPRGICIISYLVLAVVIFDQYFIPAEWQFYSKIESQQRLKSIINLIGKEGFLPRAFVYMPEKTSTPPYVIHLDAMLAAQNVNIATVNGMSGFYPYDFFYENYYECDGFFKWQAISKLRYNSKEKGKDLFKDVVILGRNCKDAKHSYSFIDSALPNKGFQARIVSNHDKLATFSGTNIKLAVNVINTSPVVWGSVARTRSEKYKIGLSYRILSHDGIELHGFNNRAFLPYDLEPGESHTFDIEVRVSLTPGKYYLEFDMLQEGVSWFREKGSKTALIQLEVFK